MSARSIGVVRYSNFGPFEWAEVDFSQPGLTGIEGLISWKPGADSNGSGKSFLIDGPAWCLWGRCLREDYTGDAVVRLGSTGGTWVEAHINGGEHSIRVTRYRQDPKYKNRVYLFVDGQDCTRGTDAETQAVIDHLLMDFTTAQSSIFFGAREDVRSFFTATDTQRKRILDQILGLSQYAEAEKVARRRLAKTATELAPLRDRVQRLEGALATQRGLLQAAPDDERLAELRLRASVEAAREAAWARAVTAQKAERDEAEADLILAQEAVADSQAEFKVAHTEYLREKARLEREERSLFRARSTADSDATRIGLSIKRHAASKGEACPTCGQALSAARHAEVAAGLQQQYEAATAYSAEVREQHEATALALQALVAPIAPVSSAVTLAADFVRFEERRLERLRHAQVLAGERAKSARAVLQSALDQREGLIEQIAANEAELTECGAAVETLEDTADRLTFWVEAFGNQGLRSFLIESEVGNVNKRATAYAQRLLGPGAQVRLSALTKLKASDAQREKLSIEAIVPGCTVTYAGASKGQKRRLDLSLLLAFRDLVAERSAGAFAQFFADELFDGLDQTGTQFVVELLREVADRGCPVVLVTHNLHLKSAADRIVTVQHLSEYLAQVVTEEAA